MTKQEAQDFASWVEEINAIAQRRLEQSIASLRSNEHYQWYASLMGDPLDIEG